MKFFCLPKELNKCEQLSNNLHQLMIVSVWKIWHFFPIKTFPEVVKFWEGKEIHVG